jgi:hypothetical protein
MWQMSTVPFCGGGQYEPPENRAGVGPLHGCEFGLGSKRWWLRPTRIRFGKVLTVTGTVRIDHPAAITVQANLPTNGVSAAKVGDLVYRGDIVQTGPDGKLGVGFVDGSSFGVSANARMELNDFVYDPHGHSNSSLMSLTKGTFTFIAGAVAQTGNMPVKTPVGTMGIRGTAPRVEILNDGSVKFSTLIEEK